MVVCIGIYIFLLVVLWMDKKSKRFKRFPKKEKRILFLSILIGNIAASVLFATEILRLPHQNEVGRNSYGEGSRLESYEVTVEGELEDEPFEIEVQEREYTNAEIQEIFAQMMEELDEVILGENESRDRVEKNLNLVKELEGYPVDIRWELDNYEVFDTEGCIQMEQTKAEGTLVEVRGILTYGPAEAVYVTHVMVYPETKEGKEKWVDAIWQSISKTEKGTRTDDKFLLPERVLGKNVVWEKKKDHTGYAVLGFGFLIGVVLIWKYRQDEEEKKQRQREQMMRDYPDILSKFTLLLSTGMTVKNVWLKIVQGYEDSKVQFGERFAYEQMRVTCHEMQGGVSEAEAYEHFGKRCEIAQYMKFGVLLSQNMKKGSRGLSDLLKLESVQALENRKSSAKLMGEKAGTKLLVPMFGMFAVVMLMVIVPAFLSIQI